MLLEQDIQKYGGKAAILNHIRDKLPDMPVPRYVVKEAGQGVDAVLSDFEAMRKPVIVRSSSPHEYGDFEGIFESVRDVHQSNLDWAVKEVEKSAASERAKEYAKQNGFTIDEKMHVIVQEQSESRYCGAIMRHPNNPDLIFISYFEKVGNNNEYNLFLFDEKTQSKAKNIAFMSARIDEEDAKFLVEQYKKIESLTDIAEGYVLFVEFGFKPFAVYQARPFKKIETAEFDLPDFDPKEDLWSDFAFGLTPPEGIVLPVVRSLGTRDAKTLSTQMFGQNYMEFKGLEMALESPLINIGGLARLSGMQLGMSERSKGYLSKALQDWHSQAEEFLDNSPYCLAISSAQISFNK